jgi:mono/diheme cytochrome c family protein
VRRAIRCLVAVALGAVVLTPPGAPAQPGPAAGDPARGRDVFAAKGCARCHVPGQRGVGPPLETLKRPQGAYELAGRLWNHVPAMFAAATHERVPWPEIGAGEMADLMAYLEADPARDPAPDPGRGLAVLLKKGCLKCHAHRGEGGRVGPDLTAPRPEYAPASAWAARMWRHTPQMAAVALQRGVLYPRFTDDEMAHLLGFLRSGGRAR